MRQSKQTRLLLEAMLKNPSGEHYGLDIAKTTGLSSGTLYPILFRLERAGWLAGDWEQIDAKVEGRSPRKYYRFTGLGERNAQAYIEEALLDRRQAYA